MQPPGLLFGRRGGAGARRESTFELEHGARIGVTELPEHPSPGQVDSVPAKHAGHKIHHHGVSALVDEGVVGAAQITVSNATTVDLVHELAQPLEKQGRKRSWSRLQRLRSKVLNEQRAPADASQEPWNTGGALEASQSLRLAMSEQRSETGPEPPIAGIVILEDGIASGQTEHDDIGARATASPEHVGDALTQLLVREIHERLHRGTSDSLPCAGASAGMLNFIKPACIIPVFCERQIPP